MLLLPPIIDNPPPPASRWTRGDYANDSTSSGFVKPSSRAKTRAKSTAAKRPSSSRIPDATHKFEAPAVLTKIRSRVRRSWSSRKSASLPSASVDLGEEGGSPAEDGIARAETVESTEEEAKQKEGTPAEVKVENIPVEGNTALNTISEEVKVTTSGTSTAEERWSNTITMRDATIEKRDATIERMSAKLLHRDLEVHMLSSDLSKAKLHAERQELIIRKLMDRLRQAESELLTQRLTRELSERDQREANRSSNTLVEEGDGGRKALERDKDGAEGGSKVASRAPTKHVESEMESLKRKHEEQMAILTDRLAECYTQLVISRREKGINPLLEWPRDAAAIYMDEIRGNGTVHPSIGQIPTLLNDWLGKGLDSHPSVTLTGSGHGWTGNRGLAGHAESRLSG